MPDLRLLRPRLAAVTALNLALVVVLTVLVHQRWAPLRELDLGVATFLFEVGRSVPGLRQLLQVLAEATATPALAVYTAATAVALWLRNHQRAAIWTVAVMLGAALSVTLLKRLIGRDRPVWEAPFVELTTLSFPSGHASGAASGAGVAAVLTMLLVRRRSLRRLLLGAALGVVVVVGLDRMLLGVHHVSDVVAGWALGAFWVCAGVLAYDPAPRSRWYDDRRDSVSVGGRRLAVVLNPIKVENPEAFKALVRRRAAAAGWDEPVWFETTTDDPGRAMAEEAAIGGADLVVVCGGDGTVRSVCAELAGTGVPVGIVPAGTGNLLARNLSIPLYLEAAVDTALTGQDRAVDLVSVGGDGLPDGQHFLVMAGMGFDAAIMAGASDLVKARVGWLAYVMSALRNLMFPAVRLEISLDGGEWTRHRARTAVIGNVGYLQAGIPLLPDARIDDGVIDVVLISPRGFLSWLPLALRVLSRHRGTDASLNRMTGRSVSIRAAHDTPRQLDGDPVGPGRELHAECLRGKLLVRVPR